MGTSVSAVENTTLLDVLIQSYPEQSLKQDGNFLLWPDGTRILFEDGIRNKDIDTLLNKPSLRDMFYAPYPLGDFKGSPRQDRDPGRVRFDPFFTKMYGDCRKKNQKPKLAKVIWLPHKWGKHIHVTTVNGVAEKVKMISRELDTLPKSFDKFLYPLGGSYNCRNIEGTDRLSPHATGTAIDLALKHSDYWIWDQKNVYDEPIWRNKIPEEIIQIFEKHGFIWGGKWYHYDTMHFEYRPEILEASKPQLGTKDVKE